MATADSQPKTNTTKPDIAKEPPSGLPGQLILESLPFGIIVFDTELEIIQVNTYAKELIDLDKKIDKSLAKIKRLDSSPVMPQLNWTEDLNSVVSNGESHNFDNLGYTSGDKAKYLRIVCKPCPAGNASQNSKGVVILEDITEKVDIQKQLAHAERLATVGKLVSKVTHELNNPMDGILRYINLAIRTIEQEGLEKPKEYLLQCRQGLMRMVHIVSDLLEFSRSTHSTLEYVPIDQVIEDAVKTMGAEVKTLNINIQRNYSPGIPKIRNANLFQVFCNLIKNAIDAMPNGGKLHFQLA